METHEMREIRDLVSRDHTVRLTYDDLTGSIPYAKKSITVKPITHLGQRKLLLTEIDFLNRVYTINAKYKLVIYAGSAPGEHMPNILDLFPAFKFLMIDPHYHLIDAKQMYIYQNRTSIDAENKKYFANMKPEGNRNKHIVRIMDKWYRNMPTMSGKMINVYTNSDSDDWYRTNNFIAKMFDPEDECRIFIIQDYLREDLCKLIRKNISALNTRLSENENISDIEVFLVSDIRTTFLNSKVLNREIKNDDRSPGDMDVMWNNCLQIIFLRSLEPRLSMLKFHPPYYGDDLTPNGSILNKIPGFVMSDIARCVEICGIDYIELYQKHFLSREVRLGDYPYFDGEIAIQAWSPITSSETRLLVSRDSIQKMRTYSSQEWEDRFVWFRFYRAYAFHPGDWHAISPEYDGCQDCQLEIRILGTYIMNELGKKFQGIDSLKPHAVKYEQIKEFIDRITFYSLRGNSKTIFHGCLTSRPMQPNIFILTPDKKWQKKTYVPNLLGSKPGWLVQDIADIYNINIAVDDKFIDCFRNLRDIDTYHRMLNTSYIRELYQEWETSYGECNQQFRVNEPMKKILKRNN